MALAESLFLVALLGISLLLYYQAGSYPAIARNLPRYFLLLLAALSLVRIAVLFFQNKAKDLRIHLKANPNMLKTVAATFLLIVGLRILGFYLTVFLFLLFLPQFLGHRKFWHRIAMSVLVLAFIYLIFNVLLKIEFPPGMLL